MSIAALTTIFTPTPFCLGGFWQGRWDWYGPDASVYFADCFPKGFIPHSTSFYSPGRCPSGYTPINTIVNTIGGSVTETTQTCCPTALEFTAQPSDVTDPPLCRSDYKSDGATTMTRMGADGKTSVNTVTTKANGNVNAYGIVIRLQATDCISPSTPSESATSTQGTTASAPTLESIATPPKPTTTSTSAHSYSGLSDTAKIGIGVGVLAGVLAILVIIGLWYIFWYLQKDNRELRKDELAMYHNQIWQHSELNRPETERQGLAPEPTYELGDNARHEMSDLGARVTTIRPQEM